MERVARGERVWFGEEGVCHGGEGYSMVGR